MPLWTPGTRRTKGGLGAGWRKLTVPQGISSLAARQAPRRSPRAAETREALPTASPPASTTSATQSSDAALRGRSWQTLALLLPNCRECVPDPVVGFTPNHVATCSRSALPVLSGESWASAAYRSDQAWCSSRLLENLAISRQLTSSDDPWEPLPEGASTRLLLERGEMRLTRHAPPYGRHSPRRPMTGLAGHLALRAAARTRKGPRGRAHDRAAQGGHAARGGIRASTSRENTNGSSGICMGCCLGEDARLAVAPLAQSLSHRACLPDKGEATTGGRRRHTMALEPLVPPDTVRVATRIAARTILASQQCTRMPQNGAKRPFLPICVHSCVPTSVHNGATVYTNGPKQLQETILANLCTLLCPWGQADPAGARTRAVSRVPQHRRPRGPRDARALGPEAHATGTVTQPPTHTNSRSLLR